MITVRKLINLKGGERFGVCNSCGKISSEDRTLIMITCSIYGNGGTSICLCEGCANALIGALDETWEEDEEIEIFFAEARGVGEQNG